jgi:hypothetical protein
MNHRIEHVLDITVKTKISKNPALPSGQVEKAYRQSNYI